MTPTLLILLTFLAAATAVAGAYSIASDVFLRDRSRASQRVDDEFRRHQRDRARKSTLFKDPGQFVAEVATGDGSGTGLRRRIDALVEQSGLELTTRQLLGLSAALGLAAGALAGLVRQSPLTAALAAPFGAWAPFLYVQWKRNARVEKLLSQLPDAFDLMSRVVRAGQTMSQALQAVSDEFKPPLATEFAYCYEQQNLGLSSELALRDLARRTGLLEVKIFVLALLVQQQTGGNLAELLDKISTLIRERFQIRGQIKSMTAEGRLQAAVLLALPVLLFFFILLFNRDYAFVLLDRPKILLACFVSEGIGALWIRKIVNFDF